MNSFWRPWVLLVSFQYGISEVLVDQKYPRHVNHIAKVRIEKDIVRLGLDMMSHYGSCVLKGAGSFYIHRKTIKDLWALAVLGVREQPNLAQNLVTHSQ